MPAVNTGDGAPGRPQCNVHLESGRSDMALTALAAVTQELKPQGDTSWGLSTSSSSERRPRHQIFLFTASRRAFAGVPPPFNGRLSDASKPRLPFCSIHDRNVDGVIESCKPAQLSDPGLTNQARGNINLWKDKVLLGGVKEMTGDGQARETDKGARQGQPRFVSPDDVGRQLVAALSEASESGVLVPRHASLELQMQDGVLVHLVVSAKVRPVSGRRAQKRYQVGRERRQ